MTAVHPTIKKFLEAWQAVDEEAYVSVFAPTFTSNDPYGQTNTLDGVREHVRAVAKGWTDLSYTFETNVTSGDMHAVAYTIHMTGTAGDWTGQRVTLKCMAFVTLAHDKIVKWDELFDTGVMRRARKKAA